MKRVLKYLIATIALGTMIASLVAVSWIIGTTAGARWLFETVSGHTDLKVSAERIEGRLKDELSLENLDIKWPQTHVKIKQLKITLEPLVLLAGTVGIKNLSMKDVSISDDTPEKPPVLNWPQAVGLIKFFSTEIERMEVAGFTYRQLDKQPLRIQTIISSIAWKSQHLSISNLHIVSDEGVVDGNMVAGFDRPLWETKLVAIPVQPMAGMDLFRVSAKFGPGQSPGELSGSLHLSGSRNKQPLWEIGVDAGMTAKGFPLKSIRLNRAGRKDLITVAGMLTLSGSEPFLSLAGEATDIDLASEFKIPTNLSGSFTFTGTSNKYRGRISLANKGKDWQSMTLAGNYSGNSESVTLSAIQGALLQGTLGGRLDVDWKSGLAMSGALSGRNLDPAGLDRKWTGIINFDLSGNVAVSKQGQPSGEVICSLKQSLLHGQRLTGYFRATFVNDDVRISHLTLQGKGFQLTAAGAVKNKLDFNVRVSDLSRLVPETRGRLLIQGWTRWHDGKPSGVISVQAGDLAAYGLEVAAADLDAVIDDQDTAPLTMKATVNKIRYHGFAADKLRLQAKGTLTRHTLVAMLRTGDHETHLTLSGGYRHDGWQGKVERLEGADSVGPWKLIQPAALSIMANSIALEPLMITGGNSESLRISGRLARAPLGGSVTLDWHALNMARANFWLNAELATGMTSGNIQLNILPQNQHLALSGKCFASGTLQVQNQKIDISTGELSIEANEKGTRIAMNLNLARGGALQGAFTSPAPARMALPEEGNFDLRWQGLDLALLSAWLPDRAKLEGKIRGEVRGKLLSQNRIMLSGKCFASGTLQVQNQKIDISTGELSIEANEKGTRLGMNLNLARGGTLQGAFTSPAPARLALPEEGNFDLRWQGLDLALLSAWLPSRTKLEGKMGGEVNGKLLPNQRVALAGHTNLAHSKIQWQEEGGDVSADLREASVDFIWQEEALSGALSVTFAEYGKVQGSFRLPIAARFPVSLDTKGQLQASLAGQLREKGGLGALFPGLIRESHGELDFDLKISGRWAEPQALGNVRLSKAGAYLPSAGISIKDTAIAARLEKDTIYIDSYRAASGQGYIDGSATIRMKGWKVKSYDGRVKGERFQTIYFPELQVQSSPNLTFYGTPEKLSVRGEILLPAASVVGSQSKGPVEGSSDVIREGKPKPAPRKMPFNLDVEVKLALGDAVFFKAAGIDAQMGGQVDLQFQALDRITGRGDIRVVKGRYRTYGVSLDIIRGRLFYAGGPLGQPALDILAWRKIGDVKAGVIVSGTLQNPLVKLYSEPHMQDMDILAYIVLGYPVSKNTSQAQVNLMVMAAGALLTSNQSEEIQQQIKNRLGFATFEIKSDVMGSRGLMGYKPIKVTPGGGGSTEQAISSSGSAETMLVVGKYLTPQIYISYGRSLFSGGNSLSLRYDVTKHWQIESQTGQASGVDIYYKLEFD